MAVNKVVFSTANGDQTLIDLTKDTATVDTVFDGTVFHGADGEQKTGTFTISAELSEQDALLDELAGVLAGKAAGGSAEPVLQEKTVTPTKSAQTVMPDTGYDGLSKVIVGAIPSEYIVPDGTLDITENGTHAVNAYANVDVNVPIPDGYVQPSGTLNITENGTYDVANKANVVVSVESVGGMEMCTVQIYSSTQNVVEAYYTGENGAVRTSAKSNLNFQCVKNSLVVISGNDTIMSMNGGTRIYGYYGYNYINVTGNCSISMGNQGAGA